MLNVSQSLLHPDQYRFGIKSTVLLYSLSICSYDSILTITQPSNLQRFRCQSTIQLGTAICYQHYFCNTALKTTTKSRIKDFRSRHNETRLYHLHLVKLTLDEHKTLTKVSMCTTSHKHSPNQSAPFGQQMQAATEQRRNKETGKKHPA